MFRVNPFRPTLKKATASYQSGDYYKSLARLDAVLTSTPDRVPALMMRGEVKQHLEDLPGALIDFKRATQLEPTNVSAWLSCGEIQYELKDYPGALESFTKTINLNLGIGDVFVLSRRGAVQYHLGNLAEALQDIKAALIMEWQDKFSLEYKSRIEQAIQIKIQALNESGQSQYRWGNYPHAIQDFSEMLKLDATNVDALKSRALAKLMLRNNQDALLDFRAAYRLDPTDFDSLIRCGEIKVRLGHYQDAIEDFDEVLKRNPRDNVALKWRGIAKYQIFDYPGALTDLNAGLDARTSHHISADDAFFLNQRDKVEKICRDKAKVLCKSGEESMRQSQYQKALITFNKSLECAPKNFFALRGRADAKRELGELISALKDFDAVLRIRPDDFYALSRRGETKRKLEDFQGALQDFTAALSTPHTDVFTVSGLGAVQCQLGKPFEALKNLNYVLSINTDDMVALCWRAEAELMIGLLPEALHDIQTVLKRKPEDAFARRVSGEIKCLMGDLNGALRDLNYAMNFEGQCFLTLIRYSEVHLKLKNYSKALEYFNSVLGVYSKDRSVDEKNCMGKFYMEHDQYLAALTCFNEILRYSPYNVYALKGRSEVLSKLKMSKISPVNYAKMDLENALAFKGRAKTHAQMGAIDKALKDIKSALQLLPNNSEILQANKEIQEIVSGKVKKFLQSAQAKYQAGDYLKALLDLSMSLSLDPINITALFYYTQSCFELGRLPEALKKINTLLRLRPKNLAAQKAKLEITRAIAMKTEKEKIAREQERIRIEQERVIKEKAIADKANTLEASSEKKYAAGNFELALAEINEALSLRSNNPRYELIKQKIEQAIKAKAEKERIAKEKAEKEKKAQAERERIAKEKVAEEMRRKAAAATCYSSSYQPASPTETSHAERYSLSTYASARSRAEEAKRDVEYHQHKYEEHKYTLDPGKLERAMSGVEEGCKRQIWALDEAIRNADNEYVKKDLKREKAYAEAELRREKDRHERRRNKNKDDD